MSNYTDTSPLSIDSDQQTTPFVRVAVGVPLRRFFDYQIDQSSDRSPCVGARVEVLFSGRIHIGIIAQINVIPEIAAEKIKKVNAILDDAPIANQSLLTLADWMIRYYHAPPGEVWQTLLPTALLKGEPAKIKRTGVWYITQVGSQALTDNRVAKNAIKQKLALEKLHQHSNGIAQDKIKNLGLNLSTLKNLAGKNWVKLNYKQSSDTRVSPSTNLPEGLELNAQQSNAVQTLCDALGKYSAWLLFGVTASGKTEVYLRLIQRVLEQGKQALVLVPEIGLTPQTLDRFQQRFNVPIETLHSNMSESQRLQSWLRARTGAAKIIIGTRSALFVPLANPGIIIIDEEHDSSFRQQQGFRYSARDVALVNASINDIPVLLGSASPSVDTLMNVKKGKIQQLTLSHKAMSKQQVNYRVIDLKNQPMRQGLSLDLIGAIKHHLNQKKQVLLFLNRRGYSPVLLCHDCGHSFSCNRCDSNFTFHSQNNYLQCHHCGVNRRAPSHCPNCECAEMVPVGLGTERLEESIKHLFPENTVQRIDRDTTRRKSSMANYVSAIKAGEIDILIGTQMLAKGHHFPNVGLVALVDMDGALYSYDFRAPEFSAQLITQVAGRTGRADKVGEVIIQTHLPDHPMLKQLIHQDYAAFADSAINERIAAELPPASFSALIQAEANFTGPVKQFLSDCKNLLQQLIAVESAFSVVELLGPTPAFYSKKAGKYRYQLYLQSSQRQALHGLLGQSVRKIESLKSSTKVRWRLEVDPIGE